MAERFKRRRFEGDAALVARTDPAPKHTPPITFPKESWFKRTGVGAAIDALWSAVFSWETASFFLFVTSMILTAHFVGDRVAIITAGGLIYMKASRNATFVINAAVRLRDEEAGGE